MKRFISLLTLGLILASNMVLTASAASYTGVDESNAFADSVVYSSGGYLFEKTGDANDAGTNDVVIGQNLNDALYLGFEQKFDGLSIDVGTAATGGKYTVEYYNGSSWATLVSETTANIQNGSSGVFSLGWTSSSAWNKTTLAINFNEETGSAETSANLYWVRLRVSSAYSSAARADQMGILQYNVVFDIDNQLGSSVTPSASDISFSSSSGDVTVYSSKDMSSGRYGYALYSPTSTTYTYTINVSGYVQESANISVSEVRTDVSETLNYTQVLVARDPDTSNEVTIASATAGTGVTSCTISGKRAYCPVPATQDDANANIYADGYAPTSAALSNRALDTDSQAMNYMTLNYAYIATVKDEDGNYVTDATVEMGDSGYTIDCDYMSSGRYGCVVPTSDDNGEIRISGDDYETMTTAFSTARNSNSDAQVTQTFTIAYECDDTAMCADPEPDEDEIDLDVVDMEWQDDGDFVFSLQNKGDEDVDADENVYVSIYVDGDREYYEMFENKSGNSFLDSGVAESFNLGDDFLDNDEDSYDVEICVDATDTVDESNENNNCYEKTLGDENTNGPDLEISDMYLENDDDFIVEITNSGDEDIDEDESIRVYVYVEGDIEYSFTIDSDDEDQNVFDEDASAEFNLGDNLLEDFDDSDDVEVCVDATDTVDESDEDNNCEEENIDELEEGANSDNDYSCEDFVDIRNHWGKDYICDLFDLGAVNGYNQYYFGPDYDVSRAEFLKMALIGAEKDVYEVSGEHFSDVSSRDWEYEYVTYASYKGYIEGYSDGTFRPDEDISRAEALVILFRIAGEDENEDERVDSDDINFWDVDRYDWFAWAVVLADDYNFVKGYNDGSFGPGNDLSRAEAAKIIDLAYEEFYQD